MTWQKKVVLYKVWQDREAITAKWYGGKGLPHEDREDIFVEAFIKVCTGDFEITTYRKTRALMYAVMRGIASNRRQKLYGRKHTRIFVQYSDVNEDLSSDSWQRRLDARVTISWLLSRYLSEQDAEALLYVYLYERRVADKVKTRAKRAMNKLRDIVKSETFSLDDDLEIAA